MPVLPFGCRFGCCQLLHHTAERGTGCCLWQQYPHASCKTFPTPQKWREKTSEAKHSCQMSVPLPSSGRGHPPPPGTGHKGRATALPCAVAGPPLCRARTGCSALQQAPGLLVLKGESEGAAATAGSGLPLLWPQSKAQQRLGSLGDWDLFSLPFPYMPSVRLYRTNVSADLRGWRMTSLKPRNTPILCGPGQMNLRGAQVLDPVGAGREQPAPPSGERDCSPGKGIWGHSALFPAMEPPLQGSAPQPSPIPCHLPFCPSSLFVI